MIRTLIVEDDPRIAEAHAELVARVPGFTAVGVVHRGAEAWDFVAQHDVDLVLLDLHLPDMSGLDVCRGLRARGYLVDIIAVTSARDIGMVRSVVASGVVQYLLKPFTFAAFKARLEGYAAFRSELTEAGTAAQHDVDRAFAALRGSRRASGPKGLSEDRLDAVVELLRSSSESGESGLSATELGERLGMARVTARRYLEHLAAQYLADRVARYSGSGRPEHVYRWRL